MHNINGHTGKVAKTHYIVGARSQDVLHAGAAFSKMAQPLSMIPGTNPSAGAGQEVALFETLKGVTLTTNAGKRGQCEDDEVGWGMKHPCYGHESKRAMWTEEELKIVKQKMEDIIDNNNGNKPANLNILVLDKIVNDPSAKPFFLHKHVESNTAIRHGIRKVQVENE
jgi:hypothetical protein